MRKWTMLVIAAILAMLISCAHGQRGGELRETRDSVYKVKVTMKLDLRPYHEWLKKQEEEARKKEEERRKAEEEKKKWWKLWNQPMTYIGETPVRLTNAQQFTDFKIASVNADTIDIGWVGTGWVAARAPGRSFVMTAGHVCESRELYAVDVYVIDWDTFTVTWHTLQLPILEKHHVMVSRDGIESVDANVIRDEDLDDDYNGNDLCMLGVGTDLGRPIKLTEREPDYGQTCSVVGAPTGLWGGGIAVASQPIYSGRGSVFGVEPDGLAFNGHLAPGNSGSAVVCDGRVAGVISLGSTRFPSLIHAVPYDKIEIFMKKALHKR